MSTRFQREAESAAKLASHPNIVGVQDIGEDDGILYLVMDLVEGTPLDELAYEGELTPEQVADIGEQMAKALAFIQPRSIWVTGIWKPMLRT